MTTLKTNAANAAVARGVTTRPVAAQLETMAEATKKLDEGFRGLDMNEDAYATAVKSEAYGRLTPQQRELFSHVYQEVLGHAAAGLGALGGGPTPQHVAAAYEEVSNVLEQQVRFSKRHGPGVVNPSPMDPGFRLEDNPDKVLRYCYRVKAEPNVDPHVLVTYREDAPPQRSTFEIGAADLTGENFLTALRKVLGGAFADVELRAMPQDGDAVTVSRAKGAAPAAPHETKQQKFTRLATELSKEVDTIPVLSGRVAEIFQHTAELSPCLAVRSTMKLGAAFEQVKPRMEQAIADWMDAHGFEDLVSRNHLGNTIYVVAADGSLGV